MAISRRPFKIDGVTIPTPSEYTYNEEDLSTEGVTGRTLDGVMHKDVVASKDYYECKWVFLSWDDIATILNAINEKESFNFTYADPRIPNRFITNRFYVGERSAAALNLTDPKKSWKSLTLKFIRI